MVTDFAQLERYKSRVDIELNTHISLRNNYIFFQVSKAASSTVKYYLQLAELEHSPWRGHVRDVNNKHLSPHLSPYQVQDRMFFDLLASNACRKVAVVRNPYARLLSCYLHRIVKDPGSRSARILARLYGKRDVSKIKFPEFIRLICDQESRDMEAHWRVQSDELMLGCVDYHFIGKVETLKEDLHRMLRLLFGPAGSGYLVDEKNLSPARTRASDKLREYYDDETVDYVRNRYQADFVALGYSTEISDDHVPDRVPTIPAQEA